MGRGARHVVVAAQMAVLSGSDSGLGHDAARNALLPCPEQRRKNPVLDKSVAPSTPRIYRFAARMGLQSYALGRRGTSSPAARSGAWVGARVASQQRPILRPSNREIAPARPRAAASAVLCHDDSMQDRQLYAQILSIRSPWQVQNVELSDCKTITIAL